MENWSVELLLTGGSVLVIADARISDTPSSNRTSAHVPDHFRPRVHSRRVEWAVGVDRDFQRGRACGGWRGDGGAWGDAGFAEEIEGFLTQEAVGRRSVLK